MTKHFKSAKFWQRDKEHWFFNTLVLNNLIPLVPLVFSSSVEFSFTNYTS